MATKGIKPENDTKELTLETDPLSYPGPERICVGSPLIDNELFFEFGDDFPEDVFTVPEWKAVFRLQRYLHNNGYEVDKNTILVCADKEPVVAEMLMKAGGVEMLERAMAVPDTKNFGKYLQKIRKAYDKRIILESKKRELQQLQQLSQDEEVDPKELIGIMDSNVAEISAKVHNVDTYNIAVIDYSAMLKDTLLRKQEGRTFEGVKTNMRSWDDMMGGLANGRLYVLGAPTGCGKSLVTISMAAASSYGVLPNDPTYKHLIIDTGELIYKDDFMPRLLSNVSGVFSYKFTNHTWADNEFDRRRVEDAARRMEKNPIIWHQMADYDGPEVRSVVRRMKHKFGIQCLWFDNIKLNPKWKPAEAYIKVGDLAQYLKDIAVELEIPVFAMIQLTNDGTVVGKKKMGFQHVHVDMYAGGRRTLQNTDVGTVMDWGNPDDPYDESRIIMVQKNRFGATHRKDERFEVTGEVRRSSLQIVKNHIRQDALPTHDPDVLSINNQSVGGILPDSKIINPSASIDDIPDF